MVIGIFGESCTGKSTIADKLKEGLNAEVHTGKDYLRFAKNEADAKLMFQKKLQESTSNEHIIYVISEKEHLLLLPENAIRILVTADLETIKERFAKRMHGNLPDPIAKLIDKKHGCFDNEPYNIHVVSNETDLDTICSQVSNLVDSTK